MRLVTWLLVCQAGGWRIMPDRVAPVLKARITPPLLLLLQVMVLACCAPCLTRSSRLC
jgi:hypothetical protein